MKKRMWMLAAMAAVVGLAGRPASAQDARIGKIDMQQVMQGYTLYQTLSTEYKEMVQRYLGEIEERARRYPLLLDEEWNQFQALQRKGQQMTPQERQQFERLGKLSDERDRELADLEALAEPTEPQRARFRELTQMRANARDGINAMKQKYQEQVDARDREVSAELKSKIEAAVGEVAKAQGLTVVVHSEVVLFGGVDLTEATLKLLNANAPAPAPAAGAPGAAPAPPAGPAAPNGGG